jgi:3-oxoacyl-[acyl-carrier-protein] synthase III
MGAQLLHISRFMPERVLTSRDLAGEKADDPLLQNDFFKAPRERRFAYPQYSSADLGTHALTTLFSRTGVDPLSVDLILYSCSITDSLNIPIGPDMQHRSGARRAVVMQVDTGCTSYITMLGLSQQLIDAGAYRRVVVVTVTNFVSRLSEFQRSPKSWVLGDGASATLLEPGKSTILGRFERAHGENHGLMLCRPRGADGQPQNYWESNTGPLQVEFSEAMVERLKTNAVELVSGAVRAVMDRAGISRDDVRWLLTHQPNMGLMAKWREAIGIGAPRVFDTFQRFGNLFHGSLPVTMSVMQEEGKLSSGDVVVMGTFANGGDYAAALALRWA